jgi:hypothetical protein
MPEPTVCMLHATQRSRFLKNKKRDDGKRATPFLYTLVQTSLRNVRNTQKEIMPERKTIERARQDKREGKAASTQAGEFVREEMHHIREGKHGARSAKQAIAIGLSKARRAGVELAPPKRGKVSDRTRRQAEHDLDRGHHAGAPRSKRRSQATLRALKHESRSAASTKSLSRQARSAAKRRSSSQRSAAARKAAATRRKNG